MSELERRQLWVIFAQAALAGNKASSTPDNPWGNGEAESNAAGSADMMLGHMDKRFPTETK